MIAALYLMEREYSTFLHILVRLSVHAAMEEAFRFTKSVDMSNTYVGGDEDNFKLNSLSLKNNVIIRAECLKFLDEEIRTGATYDIIII